MADAYWGNVNFTVVAALMVPISAIASPFLVEWWKGRSETSKSRAQVAESAAERVDRQNRENYERLLKQLERAEQLAEQAETRVDALRRQARAMESWAHWFRHGWLRRLQSYAALIELFDRHLRGDLAVERARVILDQIFGRASDDPPEVPPLHEADRTPVPETAPSRALLPRSPDK